jgi:hypothetical protein
LVEDAPTSTKHDRRRHVMGVVRGTFRERNLSKEFIEHQLNEFNASRQGVRTVPEYNARFMELLRYAPHLTTKKLKVDKFLFDLKFNIRAKVRILMPQTLHDAVQKALIAREELNGGVQGKTPSRSIGHTTSGSQQHQKPARQTSKHQDMPRGPMFTTPQ